MIHKKTLYHVVWPGSLSQINRVKHLFDTETQTRIINALVLSELFYCSSIWANSSDKNIKKLQLVQNTLLAVVSEPRRNHCEQTNDFLSRT